MSVHCNLRLGSFCYTYHTFLPAGYRNESSLEVSLLVHLHDGHADSRPRKLYLELPGTYIYSFLPPFFCLHTPLLSKSPFFSDSIFQPLHSWPIMASDLGLDINHPPESMTTFPTQDSSVITPTQDSSVITPKQDSPMITPTDNSPITTPQDQDKATDTSQQPLMPLAESRKREFDSMFFSPDPEDEETTHELSKFTCLISRTLLTVMIGVKRIKTSKTTADIIPTTLHMNEDGQVAPYDAFSAEGRPPLAIYHPSFKTAESLVSKVCNGFLQSVCEARETGYVNDDIDRICSGKLKDFLRVQDRYPYVKPIACLGPAGVGKSSGMNCILNQPGAAHESDAAHRGTNLVHEFLSSWTQQTSAYKVAAAYYRPAQVEKLVRKHCQNIFGFLDQAEELEEDEVNELQKRYETGIEFFRILLCHYKDFSSAEDAEDYFDSHREVEEEKVVKELTVLIEEFKASKNLVDCYEYYDAENVKELAEIFRKVSRVPKTSSGPHPWPIISKIQIQQDNDLLNAGVVLGDTPGIGDSNQSVVDATSKYIRKAGTVLVFESFKRIAESETLDANLRNCIRLGKRDNTHLIVTMIDGQKMKPEDRDELSEADRRRLKAAEDVVEHLKEQGKSIKQNKSIALEAGDYEQLRKLERDIEDLPVKIAMAEARVNQVIIEIRTRDVANELRGKLRKLDRSRNGPDLPVYFVSNTQYQAHLTGYEATKPPTLDVEGSGIPGVRRMLYTIPARGKSMNLTRVCKNILPSIFGSIAGVLTKSPLERKQEVKTLIEHVLTSYRELVSNLTSELKSSFDSRVTHVIGKFAKEICSGEFSMLTASSSDHNRHNWETKAERMIDVWKDYKSMTLLAFCRRSGHWRKKGQDMISWNEKIQNLMGEKVAEGFNALDDDVGAIETSAATDVTELFKCLETKLDGKHRRVEWARLAILTIFTECQGFQGVANTKKFYREIQGTRDGVLKDIDRVFGNLRTRINGIRYACVFDNDSYVSKAMQQTYKDCLLIANLDHKPINNATGKRKYQKKSTVHPRRVEMIRQKLRGAGEEPSVFAEVGAAASGAFESTLEEWMKNQYSAILEGAYEHIVADFDRRFDVPDEVKDDEDIEAIEKLKEAAENALQIVEGPLRDHLNKFEIYEKSGGMRE